MNKGGQRMRSVIFGRLAGLAALFFGVMPSAISATQTPVDRADPSVVKDELRRDDRRAPKTRAPVTITRPQAGGNDIDGAIIVGAIRIDGARMLPAAAFATTIEKYAGGTLSSNDLRNLASDIANVARDAGFGLATAWIPEQRVENGVLSVVIDEGRIDGVEVQGSGAAAARPFLIALTHGRPVRTAELERQLLLAGDVPGVRVEKTRLERRAGRNILVVQATRDRIEGRAYADNWGSNVVGPVRARLTIDFNGLLAEDDHLTIGGVITPFAPKEFGLARLAYSTTIGTAGTEVTIGGYIANSQPGGLLSEQDIDGRSVEVDFGIRHPFIRSRAVSLWGGADFRVREASQTREDELVRTDRLSIFGLSASGVYQLPGGRLRGRMALVQGVDLFDATRRGDPLSSRSDASGVFTKLDAWGEYEQDIGRDFSLLIQAEGQIANGPLLSSEEMGLGGRYFGRAWDYREFSGDRGIAGSMELRWDLTELPSPLRAVQLYGYTDAGAVANYRNGTGGGSLASAGGGIRFWLRNRMEAGIEVGVPLTNGFDPEEERDPRLSFTLGTRF
jgi:hemolysin activation/secretion protein